MHRDIKPSNLLLDTEGVVWITDFGLAKGEDEGLTQSGDILGTLRYMAPERFRGEGDARADVYALGLTLYELLTLRPGFDSSDRLKLIEQIKTEEPQRPRAVDARIPRDLETIVLKAIEKDPKARYQSAEAMGEDLGRFLADEPIRARQVSAAERYWRWARRNPAIAVLGGVLTAVLVLVTIGSLLAAGRFARLAERERQSATAERSARRDADQARKTAETARTAAQIAEQEMKKFAAQADADKKIAQQETQRAEVEKKRAEEQLTRAEWLVYAGKLMLAQNDFESGNGWLALHYLDECQWNLRGWEHRYLWTRINAKQTLLGHTNEVLSVTFSPDGQRIVTGSADRTAKVWDAQTGQELLTLEGHTVGVTSVAFSPDGHRILAGSADRTAKVWDAEIGQELPTLKGHTDFVSSIAFSPDAKRIVTGSGDGTAKVWDATTGQELLALGSPCKHWEVAGMWGVAFSPDGHRIVTGSNDWAAKVWDAATGQELLALKHTSVVSSVAFSPDGKRIVTGVGEWGRPDKQPGEAKVWDAATGRELLALKHTNVVSSVAFSPDGKRIVTGSGDKAARVWEAATGQLLLALKGHAAAVNSVAFNPDGRRIVTGSDDQTAKAWDAATGREFLALRGHTAAVNSVAFSPDGHRIVTGSDDWTAKVWDAATGQELLALKGHTDKVWSVAFSPDGKRLVTGIAGALATAKVWSAEKGQEVLVLKGHTDRVTRVAFSADGRRIFAWDTQKKVLAWSAADGGSIDPVDPLPAPPPGPARSRDGFRLAVPEGHTITVTDKRPPPKDNALPLPDAAERTHYHTEQAALAEREKQWFAAEFHLRRVLRDDPENAAVKRRLTQISSKFAYDHK